MEMHSFPAFTCNRPALPEVWFRGWYDGRACCPSAATATFRVWKFGRSPRHFLLEAFLLQPPHPLFGRHCVLGAAAAPELCADTPSTVTKDSIPRNPISPSTDRSVPQMSPVRPSSGSCRQSCSLQRCAGHRRRLVRTQFRRNSSWDKHQVAEVSITAVVGQRLASSLPVPVSPAVLCGGVSQSLCGHASGVTSGGCRFLATSFFCRPWL